MHPKQDTVVDTGEFLAISVPEEAMALRDSDCRNDRVRMIQGIRDIARQVHNAHHFNNHTTEMNWWSCPWSSCRWARQLLESVEEGPDD